MTDWPSILEAEKQGTLAPEKAAALQEARRRGLVPPMEEDPENIHASTAPEQAQDTGGVFSGMAVDLQNQFSAAGQGTTPMLHAHMPNLLSDEVFIDEFDNASFRDPVSGDLIDADSAKHIVLQDPSDKKYKVFRRTEDTNEGRLAGLGRIVGIGAVAGAPSRLAGGVQAATSVSPARQTMQAAGRQGIDLTAQTASQNRVVKGTAATLREVPGASSIMESGATREIGQTAAAVERAAASAGGATDRAVAGASARAGLKQFDEAAGRTFDLRNVDNAQLEEFVARPSRLSSFYKKAAGLYEKVSRRFGANKHLATGEASETIKVLDRIAQRFNNPKLREQFNNTFFGKLRVGLEGSQTWDDLRALRTQLRTLKAKELSDAERTIVNAEIKQIEAALTKDIYKITGRAGGGETLAALKRADRYYAAGMQRLETVRKLLKVDSDERLFDKIVSLASDKSGASIKQLNQVSRSIGNEHWGDIAAVVVRRLGKPTAGAAAEAGSFSPSRFHTNYAALSERGKDVLFSRAGMGDLRKALDDLEKVTASQKQTEKFSVPTGGGVGIGRQATTGIVGLTVTGFFDVWLTALATIGSAAGAAKLMTSPTIVRAVTNVVRGERGKDASVRVPQAVARLKMLMLGDEQFVDVADDVIMHLGEYQGTSPVNAENHKRPGRRDN